MLRTHARPLHDLHTAGRTRRRDDSPPPAPATRERASAIRSVAKVHNAPLHSRMCLPCRSSPLDWRSLHSRSHVTTPRTPHCPTAAGPQPAPRPFGGNADGNRLADDWWLCAVHANLADRITNFLDEPGLLRPALDFFVALGQEIRVFMLAARIARTAQRLQCRRRLPGRPTRLHP